MHLFSNCLVVVIPHFHQFVLILPVFVEFSHRVRRSEFCLRLPSWQWSCHSRARNAATV